MTTTRQAIVRSIEHWNRLATVATMAEAEEERISSKECALCQKFLLPPEIKEICKDCPIRNKTGHPGCRGTPYSKAFRAYHFGDLPRFQAAATEMLMFLHDVLREHDQTPTRTPSSINWDHVHQEYRYMARSKGYGGQLFKKEPTLNRELGIWEPQPGDTPIPAHGFSSYDLGTAPWDQSLVERPNDDS